MKKWTRRGFISAGVLAGGAAVFGIAIRPGNRAKKVVGFMANKGESLMNLWLKIAADNSITIIVPHAEMGQGVHTSLAMMLADELDADWDKVKIEEAPSHKEYATGGIIRGFIGGGKEYSEIMQDTMNGIFNTISKVMNMELTGGSASVRFTGKYVMRIAGAAAKSMLKEAAAEQWSVPVSELITDKSIISHPSSGKEGTYAQFAVKAAELKMPVQPVLKNPDEFKIMGTYKQRHDIPAKVNGTAQFGLDVKLPNMKYATIKASPVFGNKVTNIDSSGLSNRSHFQKVVNLEDAVALVSDGYWSAKQGLAELQIDFESTSRDKVNNESIFESFKKALEAGNKLDADLIEGNVEKAFEITENILEAQYRVPFLAHATMEPMNCTIWLQEDKCEVWLGCQNPLGAQKAVADIVDLGMHQVHVYNQYLGGGFGRKSETDIVEQAAKIAKEVPFPVKLIWSREEDIQHDKYREGSYSNFKGALNKEGNLMAWKHSYTFQTEPMEASLPPYEIPNKNIAHLDCENHLPWGNWRSVAHSKHGFFTESFIDELAHKAQKDPLTFRRNHLTKKFRSQKVLTMAAEKSNWGSELPIGKGRGVSFCESFGTIVAEIAEVTVSEDGTLKIDKVTCVADAGFAMHPNGFTAQMESGIIFGLTAALYGEITINKGAVVESNFHDYQILRMSESPIIETFIINSGETIGGAGEPSTPGIAPAVCNAIFDAVGIRIRELPIKNHDLSKKKWLV